MLKIVILGGSGGSSREDGKKKKAKVSRWGRRAEGEQERRKWMPEPISGNRLSREETNKKSTSGSSGAVPAADSLIDILWS